MAEIIWSNGDIKTYRRRWLLLSVLGLLFLLQTINFDLYENERLATHINIGYGKELQLNISPSGLIFSPLLSWLVFHKHIGFRTLVIFVSALLVLSSTINMIQFFAQKIELLNFIKQEVAKIFDIISLTIPPTLATQWFPENQINLAIGVLGIAWTGDRILASLFDEEYLNNSTLNSTNSSRIFHFNVSTLEIDNDETFYNNVLQIILILFTCLSLFIFIFSCLFVTDAPPSPPSTSQMLEQVQTNTEKSEHSKTFFGESKKLAFDIVFMFYGFAFSLIFSLILLEKEILHQIVRDFLRPNVQNSIIATNHVLALYSMGSIFGSVASGIILDRWKRHRTHAIIAAAFSFVFCLFILLACYMKILVAVCVGMVFFGITSSGSLIPLLDSILQHHFPTNPLFLTSWLSFKLNIVGFFLNLGGKILLAKLGVASILIFQCSVLFLSFILSLFAQPDLKRLEIENSRKTVSEKDALLK